MLNDKEKDRLSEMTASGFVADAAILGPNGQVSKQMTVDDLKRFRAKSDDEARAAIQNYEYQKKDYFRKLRDANGNQLNNINEQETAFDVGAVSYNPGE